MPAVDFTITSDAVVAQPQDFSVTSLAYVVQPLGIILTSSARIGDYPAFPPTLPPPALSTNVLPRQELTGFETTRIRSRRLAERPLEVREARWTFTEDQYQEFKIFFDEEIENGSLSFSTDFFGDTEEVFFQDGNYSYSHSDNLVLVVAQLCVVT